MALRMRAEIKSPNPADKQEMDSFSFLQKASVAISEGTLEFKEA